MTRLEELNAQLKYVMAKKAEVPLQEFAEMTLLLLDIIMERLGIVEKAAAILLERDTGHIDTTMPGE